MKTATTRAIALGASIGLGLGALSAMPATAADDPDVTTEPYTVAAVSAPSVEFDLAASLDRADRITADAAAAGARLVTFGELWLPGFPRVLNSDPNWVTTGFPDYAANAIVIGDANWQRVRSIADEHDVYLSIGFAEREGDHLYMAQALIGPDGAVEETRRKIRPSGSERQFFSDDVMEGNLDVAQTSLGRIGMLECWEHLHPQMTFPLHAKGEDVHVLAWPYNPTDNTGATFWEDSRVAESAARMYAMTGGTWAVSPAAGWAFIMNPLGQIVAQSGPGDEFVTATVDPSGFGGGDRYNPRGEYSWGVLDMIGDTYPDSAQVPDPEHGTLNEVSLAGLGVPGSTPTDGPTPTPTGTAGATPTGVPTGSATGPATGSAGPQPSPSGAAAGAGGGGPLALTGGDLGPWGVVGMMLIAAGAMAVLGARRRNARIGVARGASD